ncbi:MAG: hypothetical protein LBK82_11960 [Planctomycetaceae bacterium]|jgi:hypothetical protein|nr:hypothetical protein [Planctomycetaceae bacterium]
MTTKRFFNRKSSGLVMIFCVLCLFAVAGIETKSNGKNKTADCNDSFQQQPFQQQLSERSQKYLQSVQHRAANLSPELQAKLVLQAKNAVGKGLAKLNQPAELIQKQTTLADLTVFSDAVQKIGKTSALNVAAFLSRDFRRVTELEIAVRIALPLWNYGQYGKFTAKNSGTLSGSFGLDFSNGTAVVSESPRDLKTLAEILGQLASVSLMDTESVSHHFVNDDLLSGFMLIAQTVVQRK